MPFDCSVPVHCFSFTLTMISVWRPSCSWDLDHLFINCLATFDGDSGFDLVSIGQKGTEMIMFIYMYNAPQQGRTNNGVKYCHKYKSSVDLVICFKFFQLNNFMTVFHIQTHLTDRI